MPSHLISASLEQNSCNQIICGKNNSRGKDKLITSVVGDSATTLCVSLGCLHYNPLHCSSTHKNGEKNPSFLCAFSPNLTEEKGHVSHILAFASICRAPSSKEPSSWFKVFRKIANNLSNSRATFTSTNWKLPSGRSSILH